MKPLLGNNRVLQSNVSFYPSMLFSTNLYIWSLSEFDSWAVQLSLMLVCDGVKLSTGHHHQSGCHVTRLRYRRVSNEK